MTPGIARLRCCVTLSVILLVLDLGHGETFNDGAAFQKSSGNVMETRTNTFTPMHKALLTQRGYIQFLRWELPVPEINEFTFCVWVKSTNLTYPHSIFSYSKNEKDRLVRAWISSQGRSVHLEIDNVEIFAHPTNIREHRWYHICESWNNADGRYALWIDGQKKNDGFATKMAGHVIPSSGDIVLGQEYTDFDKGLEEGIEGAVLGFNLILSSAFPSTRPYFERNTLDNVGFPGQTDSINYAIGLSDPIYDSRRYSRIMTDHPVFAKIPLAVRQNSEVGSADNRFSNVASRTVGPRNFAAVETRKKRKFIPPGVWGYENSAGTEVGGKPFGQQLVDVGFKNCERGRGSPRIGGELMLISWTRTPVKVFGGAIIKNAKSDCGNF